MPRYQSRKAYAPPRQNRGRAWRTKKPASVQLSWSKLPQPDDAAWEKAGRDNELETELQKKWRKKVSEDVVEVDMVYDVVPFWIQSVEAADKGKVLKMNHFLKRVEKQNAKDKKERELQPGEGWFIEGAGRNDDWDRPDIPRQYDDWESGSAESVEEEPVWSAGWGTYKFEQPECTPEEWHRLIDECERDSPWGRSDKTKNEAESENGRPQRVNRGSEVGHATQDSSSRGRHDFVEQVASRRAVGEQKKEAMYRFYEMGTDEKVQSIQQMIHDLRAR